ncbi:MAG: molybdenum cofactor guanylyltransferase [Nocardioides sp.]
MEIWHAVVLSGGSARRLGGADKGALAYSGTTLLEHALDSVAGASRVVVVGPTVATERTVQFAREDPPGGGPVAGLLAGAAALDEPAAEIVVLAVDLPHVDAGTVARLRAVRGAHEAAYLVDEAGRRQVAGVHAPGSLSGFGDAHGRSLRAFLRDLDVVDAPALGRENDDVDTWSDVEHLRGT